MPTSRHWPPDTLLKFVPGVGPSRADRLERLGLVRVVDLLLHFPRRYEDRREERRVATVRVGDVVVLRGRLEELRERPLSGGRRLTSGRLIDATGTIELVWFNQAYLAEVLRPGMFLDVYGEVKQHGRRLQIVAPEFEIDTGDCDLDGAPSLHIHRIVPVYSVTRGVHQRFLRRLVYRVLEGGVEEPDGPCSTLDWKLPTLEDALWTMHFPRELDDVEVARERFVREEFFRFASHLHFRRSRFRRPGRTPFRVTEALDRKIRSIFPFRFTADQDRAIRDIAGDLTRDVPMYRLLQGDVGTGKTAIALYAMLVAVRNGFQAAILAPTELLAEQHLRVVRHYLRAHPVRVALLTSSITASEREIVLEKLESGAAHIVVGTHALVQDHVTFSRLGVVVIDEQHRFGVMERSKMRKKGDDPHLLVMTATPIPRSLCLTCYGDLDLSMLRERPAGRTAVKTTLVTSKNREAAYRRVRTELAAGRQAYFVYPLIEESESLDLPAAVAAHRRLQDDVFAEYRVGLVHGRLPGREKEEVLQRFRRGEYHILVTTVVVEVGIDVPNATVIVIEDATRFGLAQLHQLRGRVGRGRHPGHCLVGVERAPRDARSRLRAFAATDDGFVLAEEDLRLRGPGDYLGIRQSGRPLEALGNPLFDIERFLEVRREAEVFWSRPGSEEFRRRWSGWLRSAPGLFGDEFVGLD